MCWIWASGAVPGALVAGPAQLGACVVPVGVPGGREAPDGGCARAGGAAAQARAQDAHPDGARGRQVRDARAPADAADRGGGSEAHHPGVREEIVPGGKGAQARAGHLPAPVRAAPRRGA